ncbi:conserved exported hypothetical protein [Magnetospirillum sp. LM-5]|uniref:DUF4139 domain-containing protein n=1 Tax=Magnetospirillum sp. LM-5 TaxID=2681466 RepID=UPI001382608C|nr:DUF4139 domain-containing protein [Magnetospirillum sp. LM-5]CAA7616580.1 conserved exported hypothetical protein [Magnetospirillum sp. LM-5]
MRRILALLMTTALLPPLAAADTIVTHADRAALSLTITQAGQALVRDRRTVTLDKGGQVLVFEGVSPQAQDGSAWLSGAGLQTREQAFAVGGIDAARLLAGAIGSEVTVTWPGGREERATVLAADGVPVFRINGRVVAGQPERVLYDALPESLRAAPSFVATVSSDLTGKREIELDYLAGGLDWTADYTAELAPSGDRLTLTSWATIANQGGTEFTNAHLQLVAGEVSRQGAPSVPMRAAKTLMAAAEAMPAREELGPHHLYTIAQPVTLAAGERRQVALMAPASLAVERKLVLDGAPHHAWRGRWADRAMLHPQAQMSLRNSTGQPLPAGTLRVYQRGRDGQANLVGEDRLGPVPAGAVAQVSLGRAFDVTARRVQTDFQKVSAEISESAIEVRLANGGERPARVTVRESFGPEWLVLSESSPHTKDDAFTASWVIEVPAKGETVLAIRARVKG